MMNAEFIRELYAQRWSNAPTDQIDQYTRIYRNEGGDANRVDIDPKPRTSIAYSIADLVHNVYQTTLTHADGCEIFYSRKGIRGFYDSKRRESITMQFTKSKSFAQLEEWDKRSEVVKQDDFVHRLKTMFRGTTEEALQKIVSSLKWEYGNKGTSTVSHSGVSINKSLLSEMSGAEDLNKIEYVWFNVPIFDELPHVKYRIECYIRPYADSQAFSIHPTGNHIEEAYRAAEGAMLAMIKSAMTIVGEDAEGQSAYQKMAGIEVYHGVAEADNKFAVRLDPKAKD